MISPDHHKWHPLTAFVTRVPHSALIVLDQPITRANETKLELLWRHTTLKLCADGAANRLHEWSSARNELDAYKPDLICGDLDSIRTEIREFYEKRGTPCICLSNQDMSDFTKTLRLVVTCISKGEFDAELDDSSADSSVSPSSHQNHHNHFTRNIFERLVPRVPIELVYCFSDFTGRVDHVIGNLSCLYEECVSGLEVYLVSAESVTFLLRPGGDEATKNLVLVRCGDEERLCGKYCGMFALGEAARCVTKGLKWNLSGERALRFGVFGSSSNEFSTNDEKEILEIMQDNGDMNEKCVLVTQTDRNVLFTMSVN